MITEPGKKQGSFPYVLTDFRRFMRALDKLHMSYRNYGSGKLHGFNFCADCLPDFDRVSPPAQHFSNGKCSFCGKSGHVCDPWVSALYSAAKIDPDHRHVATPLLRQPFPTNPVMSEVRLLTCLASVIFSRPKTGGK